MLKGIYHAHSTYSYDGKKDIDEIAAWVQENDYDFIILTEHDYGFSEEKFQDYLNKCRNIDEVTIIPGIEYSFDSEKGPIHISVFGLENFIDLTKLPLSIEKFLQKVKENGGVSVLNHSFRVIGQLKGVAFEILDFIEAWNLVYDIKYAPNKGIIKHSKKSQFKGKYLSSSDIHKYENRNKYPYLEIYLDKKEGNEKLIIENLKLGNYKSISRMWHIYPEGNFSPICSIFKTLPFISLMHQNFYEKLRELYYRKFKTVPPKWLIKMVK